MPIRRRVVPVCVVAAALALASRGLCAQQPAATLGDGGGAVVTGTVYDSIGARPIAGAVVQLVQRARPTYSYASRSDSAGHFRIPGVSPGRYIAGFQDPLLDSLGIDPPLRAVSVESGHPVTIDLATPSGATLRASLCPLHGPADSTGAMLGRVGDADSGQPLAGATVVAIWSEIVIDGHGLHADRREIPVKTNEVGWYAICGLPAGELMARAESGVRASGYVPVAIPVRGVARRDLAIAPDSAAVVAADTAHPGSEPLRRGTAGLTGIVRDDRGQPLANAAVVLLGTRASAATDQDGRFGLAHLPAGTQTVEARKLGFMPERVAVDLASNRTTTTSIVFETRVAALRPVTVYGRARHGGLTSFLSRRERGRGTFLTRADIESLHPFEMSDLFRMMPGLRLTPSGSSGYTISSAHSAGVGCRTPTIYLDGLRMDGDFDRNLDSYLPPQDVAGIEVYSSDAEAPPQYPGGGCGVILIWTGNRAP